MQHKPEWVTKNKNNTKYNTITKIPGAPPPPPNNTPQPHKQLYWALASLQLSACEKRFPRFSRRREGQGSSGFQGRAGSATEKDCCLDPARQEHLREGT